MGRIRKFGVAVVMAAVLAVGMGTTAQAANKKPGGGGQQAICSYLSEIIHYKYVTPAILTWALALWDYYNCE
ncbi:MAG TPA: hypothetical protein VN716_17095 [Vicinamibacterales bacterium]|jgi:hypothetical protein|nr:hypothetical protein [Vicinamibacterales bacterium]